MSEYNCPNCGAPIDGVKCAYCGTWFWNIADIDDKKPRYIRIPIGGHKMMFNVIATDISIEQTPNVTELYADNVKQAVFTANEVRINLGLTCVSDENGVMAKMKKENEE